MRIRKKTLLYEISNLAYVIADTGEHQRHILHRVRDICEEGNIDRVNRVLALAFSKVATVIRPVGSSQLDEDFHIHFRHDAEMRYVLTSEKKMNIKETVNEYLVCMVLADWLGITLPEAADVWIFRAEGCLDALGVMVTSLTSGGSCAFSRHVSPI